MTPTRRRVLIAGAGAATVAMPWVARAQRAIRMRLAHAANEVHPGHIATVRFKEALEKLLPGRVNIQIFSNRQLGDDKQSLESAIAGTVELAGASGVQFPLVTGRPALAAYQLPFLIRDYDHFTKLATSEVAQKMLDDLAPAGLVGVADHRYRPAELSVGRKAGEDDRRFRRPEDPHRAGAAAQANLGGRRHSAGRFALWRGLQRAADQGDRRGRDQRVLRCRREPVGGRKVHDADRALSLAQRHRRQQGVL